MAMQDYWNALGSRQRMGLASGALACVVATAALGFWALHDPMVPLASGLSPERQAAVARELERDKIAYRIGDDGETVLVPSSAAGKARAAMSNGGLGLPPSAGLEIFKEADFSTTDFAQRMNYQRALQGELTRTLQTIAGVRSARVHVILAEGGLLKRGNTKASVAITLQLLPGKLLSRSQVTGIQRLVAASVPEIQPADVVVLDESGNALNRAGGVAETDGEASGAQLDLKTRVDSYVEAKLAKMLADIAPGGQVTLSVDTALDFKQLKVTTEEPIAASGKGGDHPTGMVVKERQSQRPSGDGAQAKAGGADVADWEYEYQVGKRVEQSLSVPGAVKRLSVAVAIHGAPDNITNAMVEQLVEHAIGLDRSRGDSVAVVLLPALKPAVAMGNETGMQGGMPATTHPSHMAADASARDNASVVLSWPLLIGLSLLALVASVWTARRQMAASKAAAPIDIDAATAQVRAWLRREGNHR